MKNKTIPTVYRIFAILSFVCGVIMSSQLSKIMIWALNDEDVSEKVRDNALENFGLYAMIFLAITVICLLMSIVCFKAAKPVSSVFRTIFTAIAIALTAPANVFLDASTVDMDEEIAKLFLPSIAVFIAFVICITSIVALVKGPVLSDKKTEA